MREDEDLTLCGRRRGSVSQLKGKGEMEKGGCVFLYGEDGGGKCLSEMYFSFLVVMVAL